MANKKWLAQSCCDRGLTQIITDNNLLPGDIFQDSQGNCYTVLLATDGNPTIVRTNQTLYTTCEKCGTCPSPSPSPTPSVTQTPFPTPSMTPSVTVTPSSTTYNFVSKTPSVTPSITPSTSKGAILSPTPTPSSTPISGSSVEPADLCMDVVFGPAPSPSATPSVTVSITPSITVSPSPYPIYPSLSSAATPSVTPSVTPSKTPSISVSTTPSVTPSITPTKTVTPSTTPSVTPSITVSPSKTPSVTPSPSSNSIVVSECSVLLIDTYGKTYAYNSTTNVSTLLPVPTTLSTDIAHTTSKLWLTAAVGTVLNIIEYDITLSPFNATFNRTISLPVNFMLGAGMCAINNTTLISSVFPSFSTEQIVQITLNPDNTTTLSTLFPVAPGRRVSGDIIYTTDNKVILTTYATSGPQYYYISQYTLNSSGVWTLEFDLDITTTSPLNLGIATINGGIYTFSYTNLKQIGTAFPYNVTQINDTTIRVAGASQVPSCNTASFQPDIIGPSPSPTSTPTKTVTPSVTVSLSTTPSRTPTPTPSPSPPNSNCTGKLPLPGGSLTYNGITITASGTGALALYANSLASCAVSSQFNTIDLGYPGLPFSYTLTFSQPVNNIKLYLTAIFGTEPHIEYFTFTTDTGIPTILSTNSCQVSISGNTVTGTGVNGGGTFAISAPSSYTVLTVSGVGGGNNGQGIASTPMSIDCNSISPFQSSCASCDIQPLPVGGNGTTTFNNITLTTTYSGPSIPTAILPQPNNMTCVGLATPSPAQTVTLGYNDGAFIYTINFSQPVNNIKFLINGGGNLNFPTLFETFTFNTDGGVPALTSCGVSCSATINNNILQLGSVLPYGGSVLAQVSAISNYTKIIITGPGGLLGSSFSLCADTATPLPSTSPSVTPSVTVSPSKTPSVTATPSATPSLTPSVTPSITVSPSITPSPSSGFAASCNTILYKTQTSQYYSYNFSTNTSTLLNVPVPSYDAIATSLSLPINNLANTSNKLWSYTWNTNGGNNSNSIVEYNTTSNPFTATINRYISLPKISNQDASPGNGLFAISNTKLVGTINKISYVNLYGNVTEQDITNNPLLQYANGVMIVEYDITSNEATWTLKAKLMPNEIAYSGLLVTTNNKLLVVTQQSTFNGSGTHSHFINQFNYNTGVLEFRKEITPIITTQCGLSEVNGNVYLMGYNVYKIDTVAPYNLTLIQTNGNQLVASSQLSSCIDTNFPISSCPECLALPLKLVTPMTYNGITIIPSYNGPTASDNTHPGVWSSCSESVIMTQPPFSAFLGNVAGDYIYTLTFSQPVNNIKIQYNGTNSNPNPYELFTWNTNGGTPSINLCKGCYQTINDNTISASWSGAPDYIGGGGVITITAPSSYTTLTLTSPGGNQGTIFSICSSNIVPAPAVSPSPTPTPSLTPSITPSTSPPSTGLLGCVYYSSNNNTYNYNPVNNISTQVTLPTDTFTNFAETHTSTKYWKGNQTSTIKEWIPTTNPTTLALNRTITVSGITSMFGNYFIFLQAIDDTTLLTTIANSQVTSAGEYRNSLVRLDITDNTITTTQMTTMFDIYAPAGLDSILLTSTNKLITVGKRNTPSAQNVTYLSQYSYPEGVLEADIDISSTVLDTNAQRYLFESNGNLFVSIQYPPPTSTIYSININSPYTLTPVYTNMNLFGATFNSSINCNTVNLIVPPIPSPSPTPSTSPPSTAFRTIYKYLDIQ
jgi:hypothetical protein